jgi:hypothetical protein
MVSSYPHERDDTEQKPLTMLGNSPKGELENLGQVPSPPTTATNVSFSNNSEPLVFLTGTEVRSIEADSVLSVFDVMEARQ